MIQFFLQSMALAGCILGVMWSVMGFWWLTQHQMTEYPGWVRFGVFMTYPVAIGAVLITAGIQGA